jgi:hypothetical protein
MFEIHDRLVYRPATLVFRTVHIDRAGETVSQRVVSAEIADVNADGDALLVSDDGAHLWFPVASLHAIVDAADSPEAVRLIGGQELVRDFHAASAGSRVSLRWLDRRETKRLLGPPGQTRE